MPHSSFATASIRITLLTLCAACVFAAPAERKVTQMNISNLPPHPRLLLSRDGIGEMKDRIQRYDWAKAHWETIRKAADKALVEDAAVIVRARFGGITE